MYETEQTTTVSIKPCRSCGAGMIEESKFCRSCGEPQCFILASHSPATIDIPQAQPARRYVTRRISQVKLYHPVSGPLVNAVAAGVPTNVTASQGGSISKRMLLPLMAIPIWLMIILLSPLDAYASAKIIGNRI